MILRCCWFNIMNLFQVLVLAHYGTATYSILHREKKGPEIERELKRMRSLLSAPKDEEHDELATESDNTHTYTWVVQLDLNNIGDVEALAVKYDFDNIRKLDIGEGIYRFSRSSGNKKDNKFNYKREKIPEVMDDAVAGEKVDAKPKDSIYFIQRSLMIDPKVKWLKRERIIEREKRVPISHHKSEENYEILFEKMNDPQIKNEWYIKNIGQTTGPAYFDSRISKVWDMGISGKGVVVSILDDGMDHTHPELVDNYDPEASTDLNDKDDDPFPDDTDPYNAHGTKCSGTVAAKADNSICGAGIAYNSKIGAIRMLDGKATDGLEADALSFHRNHIDIYSCSWGPKDNGQTFGRPGHLGRIALYQGAKFGRKGLGSIFVWATGNGGMMQDDCNADGYVNSIYTLGIGAVNEHGVSTFYGEHCSAMMAVTYCSGKHKTSSYSNSNANVITTYLHHRCTNHFVGTSSAAPLAAGIIALVLEANPKLNWRDIQHLVYHTANKTSPYDLGWRLNGCGKPYNHKFGFGVLDAEKLVSLAINWTTVPEQKSCHFRLNFGDGDIPSRHHFKLNFTTDGCHSCKSPMEDGTCKNAITSLEHVLVNVTLKHRRRGDLSIDIISPSGTVSHLLHARPFDSSNTGLKRWTFMTLFNWCENPKGVWQLIFTDNKVSFTHGEPYKDMEEEYIQELDRKKKENENRRQNLENNDKSGVASIGKQIYDPDFNIENKSKDSVHHQFFYDTAKKSYYNRINERYQKRSQYDYRNVYDYLRRTEKRTSSDTVDVVDDTDFVLYKKGFENFDYTYKDDVLKGSILAGEVQDLSITFYGS